MCDLFRYSMTEGHQALSSITKSQSVLRAIRAVGQCTEAFAKPPACGITGPTRRPSFKRQSWTDDKFTPTKVGERVYLVA